MEKTGFFHLPAKTCQPCLQFIADCSSWLEMFLHKCQNLWHVSFNLISYSLLSCSVCIHLMKKLSLSQSFIYNNINGFLLKCSCLKNLFNNRHYTDLYLKKIILMLFPFITPFL